VSERVFQVTSDRTYSRNRRNGHTGDTRPGQTGKTPKNLSTHESEECGREESVGLYGVYMCERRGWGREGDGLRNVISDVMHT
jgi:hypothetical protein